MDIADPRSLAEARAPALREILLWEYGNDFRNDPQFLPMVDVNSSLDRAPNLQQQFVYLIAAPRNTRLGISPNGGLTRSASRRNVISVTANVRRRCR